MSYHVRSCTFVTYLMVLFLWSCSYEVMVLSLEVSDISNGFRCICYSLGRL